MLACTLCRRRRPARSCTDTDPSTQGLGTRRRRRRGGRARAQGRRHGGLGPTPAGGAKAQAGPAEPTTRARPGRNNEDDGGGPGRSAHRGGDGAARDGRRRRQCVQANMQPSQAAPRPALCAAAKRPFMCSVPDGDDNVHVVVDVLIFNKSFHQSIHPSRFSVIFAVNYFNHHSLWQKATFFSDLRVVKSATLYSIVSTASSAPGHATVIHPIRSHRCSYYSVFV